MGQKRAQNGTENQKTSKQNKKKQKKNSVKTKIEAARNLRNARHRHRRHRRRWRAKTRKRQRHQCVPTAHHLVCDDAFHSCPQSPERRAFTCCLLFVGLFVFLVFRCRVAIFAAGPSHSLRRYRMKGIEKEREARKWTLSRRPTVRSTVYSCDRTPTQ